MLNRTKIVTCTFNFGVPMNINIEVRLMNYEYALILSRAELLSLMVIRNPVQSLMALSKSVF